MIEFSVERNSIFYELIIEHLGMKMSTGLLTNEESTDIARQLIDVIEDLLPPKYKSQIEILSTLRKGLDT